MSTKVTSGTNLSASYFLRNFYKNNTEAMKASTRDNCSDIQLSYDDSLALHKAIKKLSKYNYNESENKDNISGTIMAFVKTYNNSLDSSSNSSSLDMKRYEKQLKKLSSKYADELEDIGITIEKNGTLKANENLVKKASIDKINKVFGKDSSFTSNVYRISKHMSTSSYDDYYTSLYKGQNINMTI